MSSYRLQIVTPEGGKFDGEAEALHLRTTEGYVSIRAQHADYLAALDIGIVTLTVNGKERKAACGGGFLSVDRGEARLVATSFEYADEIDTARAENAKRRAEEKLAATKDAKEIELARVKLARALNRLRVSEV